MSAGGEREFIDYLQRKEGKTMKCPLSFGWIDHGKEDRGFADYECIKEECAGWDSTHSQCLIKSIWYALNEIAYELREIREKMPHELQFRK